VAKCIHRFLHILGWVRLDPAVLVSDRPAGAFQQGVVALRHEPAHADGAPGGQQMVGALGAQPVGDGRHPLHVPHPHRPAQRGELVDDYIGLGLGHRVGHRVGVKRVNDDRFGAGRAARRSWPPSGSCRRPGGRAPQVALVVIASIRNRTKVRTN
jgi:hypothetical protein